MLILREISLENSCNSLLFWNSSQTVLLCRNKVVLWLRDMMNDMENPYEEGSSVWDKLAIPCHFFLPCLISWDVTLVHQCAVSGFPQWCYCISMANEANRDAHYRCRSSGLSHTVAVVMSLLSIPVINLASVHSKEVCQELTGGGIQTSLDISFTTASGRSRPLRNTLKLVVKLFREHCNYGQRWPREMRDHFHLMKNLYPDCYHVSSYDDSKTQAFL